MKLVDENPLEFRAPNGVPSKCRVRVYGKLPYRFNKNDVVVIATQLGEGEDAGMSITNAAETIATLIVRCHSIQPMSLIWIEHYPDRGHRGEIKETLDRVHFDVVLGRESVRLEHPKWAHFNDRAFIERLIGETF